MRIAVPAIKDAYFLCCLVNENLSTYLLARRWGRGGWEKLDSDVMCMAVQPGCRAYNFLFISLTCSSLVNITCHITLSLCYLQPCIIFLYSLLYSYVIHHELFGYIIC